MSCEKMLIVNEIFTSIDGEGARAGELATFVRLAGCNLRCSYCDTNYALKMHDGTPMSIHNIVNVCLVHRVHNVTLTGGEPLMQTAAVDLIKAMVEAGLSVNIETNGSKDIGDVVQILEGTDSIITMDIKCPSSGMADRNLYENMSKLRETDVVKFVVGSKEDMEFMLECADTYPCKAQWYISPVFGEIEPVEIVKFMQEHLLLTARIQLQLHKIIWDPSERGV